jgi:hypothetical protein
MDSRKQPTIYRDSMMDVNYHAVVAAAEACTSLGFEHFVQSSTQAVKAGRAGQVF